MPKIEAFSLRQVEYDLPVPDLLTAFGVSVWRVSMRGDTAVLVGLRERTRTPIGQQNQALAEVEGDERVR